MEMSKFKTSLVESEDIIKTKPFYGRKTFLWEIQSIESVMEDGVQRAIACDFDIADITNVTIRSKWRLHLDSVDDEPAFVIHRISPKDKVIFFRLSIHVMKNEKEPTDIISYPNANLFYESSNTNNWNSDLRKFTLHRQLDYGCSYTSWFKDVLNQGSLLLKVEFETCESNNV